jgi:hypothetical protein
MPRMEAPPGIFSAATSASMPRTVVFRGYEISVGR